MQLSFVNESASVEWLDWTMIEGCLKFGVCYVKRKIKFVYNLFWRDVLQSFSMYINFQEPKTWVDFLQSPLWYNHNTVELQWLEHPWDHAN